MICEVLSESGLWAPPEDLHLRLKRRRPRAFSSFWRILPIRSHCRRDTVPAARYVAPAIAPSSPSCCAQQPRPPGG
eukprot:4401645-Pyramimonas_sp.AAC.1